LGFIAYKNNPQRRVPIVFSPRNELQSLWQQYKQEFLETNTYRVLDKQKGDITTSEGESYSMLRAVWLDDKDTFDKSWTWTKNNIGRQDHLFSWLFGKLPNGKYGIITNQGGQNSASDADTDIALALVFGASRWNQPAYLDEAKNIISNIWSEEVVTIQGKPYLTSNNLEKDSPATVVINPSYFAPYAYRIFAKIDPAHPWLKLIDTSYEVLQKSMASTLDTGTSANIPPDWILMDRKTGQILPQKTETQTTNMSYDALRIPWRLALDWQWFGEPRARQTLAQMKFLGNEWRRNGLLYTSYTHGGEAVGTSQSAAFYGGTLGYFIVSEPDVAKTVYDNKLQYLFTPDSNTWKVNLGYYDSNWGWFGIALYNNFLPNLATSL
jgi:endo-1,4-beta-D-glucanase Y